MIPVTEAETDVHKNTYFDHKKPVQGMIEAQFCSQYNQYKAQTESLATKAEKLYKNLSENLCIIYV